MSLLYQLFGFPQTPDEFQDLLHRRKIKEVDIQITTFSRPNPLGRDYLAQVNAQVYGMRPFKVWEGVYFSENVWGVNSAIQEMGQVPLLSYKAALDFSRSLQQRGVTSTINGCPFQDAERLRQIAILSRVEKGLDAAEEEMDGRDHLDDILED